MEDCEIRFVVKDMSTKQQLLEASKHIHDSRDIDTDIPMVNLIAHIHHNPELIEVAHSEVSATFDDDRR